jgi:isocitrate dehydrogenase kinase/phosphatase
MILCLLHEERGIALDAVLLGEDAASMVFGFTRSYFHVDADRPGRLVQFLKPLMPLKKVAELYISLGFNKHGKTELYRDLRRHLEASSDRFETRPGRGAW